MPTAKAKISIDGEIFLGFASASRVLACDSHYLIYKAHQYKGVFEFRNRKIKVLNFPDIANYQSYEKNKLIRKAGKKKYQKTEKWKSYARKYSSSHRERINERNRKYYAKKKNLQLSNTDTEKQLVG